MFSVTLVMRQRTIPWVRFCYEAIRGKGKCPVLGKVKMSCNNNHLKQGSLKSDNAGGVYEYSGHFGFASASARYLKAN